MAGAKSGGTSAGSTRRAPRFVFLTDADREDGAGRFAWRLVAANHRPLGRGAKITASLAECRVAAVHVHDEIDVASVSVGAANGRWSWRMTVAGEPVAVCVRPYLRRVECVRGLDQFTAAVRIADPADGVVRSFGPNTLCSYEEGA